MTTTTTNNSEIIRANKLRVIRDILLKIPVKHCCIRWDYVIWRTGENSWIVGEEGVRRDAFQHDINSAVEWVAWKRGFLNRNPS